MDVAEVGLAVADAEGKTVDILYTRVRVGVGALGEWHVLIVFRTLALLPGPTDRSRHLAAVRVIDVGALATAVVIVVEDSELSAIDRAQILDRHPQHHRHHDIDLRLSITPILRPT